MYILVKPNPVFITALSSKRFNEMIFVEFVKKMCRRGSRPVLETRQKSSELISETLLELKFEIKLFLNEVHENS